MQYYSNLVACSRFDFCNQGVSRAWDRGGWQMRLPNYVSGRWCRGLGSGELLVDPVTGDELVSISSEGIDLEAALQFARAHGGPALRQRSYAQGRICWPRSPRPWLPIATNTFGSLSSTWALP